MPIDYSKWDHLDEYSGDDDSDGSNENVDGCPLINPRITRLDGPSRVTFGGKHVKKPLVEPSSVSSRTSGPKSPSQSDVPAAVENVTKKRPPSSWTERGGCVTKTTVDGKKRRMLYWSQDRYSVALRLELISVDEKVQVVNVSGILPYCDRFSATGSTRPHLCCQVFTNKTNDGKNHKVSSMLLEGELPHPVHLAEGDDDVDWSVVRDGSNRRFMMITFYKAVPMQGIFVWWRRPLMEFPEIDIEQVKDQTSGTASRSFLKTWEEAHKIFQEEKNKKKHTIL